MSRLANRSASPLLYLKGTENEQGALSNGANGAKFSRTFVILIGVSLAATLSIGLLLCTHLSESPLRKHPQLPVTSIPHIIHQSYKTRNISEAVRLWSESWKINHPRWKYVFWTDDDNRKLVQTHVPWFLPVYDGFKKGIQRADSCRYIYMYVYGGVYADLDMESIKPLDDLLKGERLVLGSLSDDNSFKDRVPNAFMASVPGHPFWMLCLAEIVQNFDSDYAEFSTGPQVLLRVLEKYRTPYNLNDIKVHPHELIYPFRWHNNTKEELRHCSSSVHGNTDVYRRRCRDLYPEAYTVTFWTHGWKRDS